MRRNRSERRQCRRWAEGEDTLVIGVKRNLYPAGGQEAVHTSQRRLERLRSCEIALDNSTPARSITRTRPTPNEGMDPCSAGRKPFDQSRSIVGCSSGKQNRRKTSKSTTAAYPGPAWCLISGYFDRSPPAYVERIDFLASDVTRKNRRTVWGNGYLRIIESRINHPS